MSSDSLRFERALLRQPILRATGVCGALVLAYVATGGTPALVAGGVAGLAIGAIAWTARLWGARPLRAMLPMRESGAPLVGLARRYAGDYTLQGVRGAEPHGDRWILAGGGEMTPTHRLRVGMDGLIEGDAAEGPPFTGPRFVGLWTEDTGAPGHAGGVIAPLALKLLEQIHRVPDPRRPGAPIPAILQPDTATPADLCLVLPTGEELLYRRSS